MSIGELRMVLCCPTEVLRGTSLRRYPKGMGETKWRASLTGEVVELEYLCSQLNSGPIRVCRDGDEYGIAMDAFAGLEPTEMFRLVKQQLPTLNGALRLLRDARQPIVLTHMRGYQGDTKRAVVVADTANLVVHSRVVVAGTGMVNGNSTSKLRYPMNVLVTLARSNGAVADALRLSADQTWVGLYRLYEVIEADIGSLEGIAANGWATRTELRHFKYTANSPGAIGDDTRHGRESTMPPKNPLTIEEARELMAQVMRCWVAAKNPDAV